MTPMVFATIAAVAFANTASAACTYKVDSTVTEDGETQHRFFNDCGFYEVGYRLEGNTLYFPRGGTHTLSDLPVPEAQAILTETYGLLDIGAENLIRTKGFFGPQDNVANSSTKTDQK